MAIPDGLKIVDAEVVKQNFNHGRTIMELLPKARERAINQGTSFSESKCGLGYNEGSHEIQMWHFSFMFAEYFSGLIELKAREGHCYRHKPCPDGRRLHREMLRRYRMDLQALVVEIETLESNLDANT